MKRKILTKLISIVCALAMATSCAAMSVGVMSVAASEIINWAQQRDTANALADRARGVFDNGSPLDDCRALADDIEAFSHRNAYHILVENGLYEDGIIYILEHLRSDDLSQRELGLGYAIDHFSDIAEFSENHIDAQNM